MGVTGRVEAVAEVEGAVQPKDVTYAVPAMILLIDVLIIVVLVWDPANQLRIFSMLNAFQIQQYVIPVLAAPPAAQKILRAQGATHQEAPVLLKRMTHRNVLLGKKVILAQMDGVSTRHKMEI